MITQFSVCLCKERYECIPEQMTHETFDGPKSDILRQLSERQEIVAGTNMDSEGIE